MFCLCQQDNRNGLGQNSPPANCMTESEKRLKERMGGGGGGIKGELTDLSRCVQYPQQPAIKLVTPSPLLQWESLSIFNLPSQQPVILLALYCRGESRIFYCFQVRNTDIFSLSASTAGVILWFYCQILTHSGFVYLSVDETTRSCCQLVVSVCFPESPWICGV